MSDKNTGPERTELVRILQTFDDRHLTDIAGEIEREMDRVGFSPMPGARIAIAVGSRGVANIALIVRSVVSKLIGMGARPFIVPAMGSHGGATALGQRAVLEGYGVTEEYTGAPILSSMDVVRVPAPELPIPLYMDRHAWESDGVILVNRIKLHTDYHGHPESGLMKMAVIGLGKHAQALAVHDGGVEGLKNMIAPAARKIFGTGKVLLGIGCVENARDRTMILRAIPPSRIEAEERELLAISARNMPRLPVEDLDILIIDEMGKDVSGVGMDTNIIGRIRVPGQEEPSSPRVKSIITCSLTPASHGNAIGVGLADVILRGLFDSIDFCATYENTATSSFLERAKIPMIADDARQAFAWARRGAAMGPEREPRVIRITSTLHLDELLVSRNLLPELSGRPGITVTEDVVPLFGEDGRFAKRDRHG